MGSAADPGLKRRWLACGCTDTSGPSYIAPEQWCDDHRCAAVKRGGGQCTNRAKYGLVCGVHRVAWAKLASPPDGHDKLQRAS